MDFEHNISTYDSLSTMNYKATDSTAFSTRFTKTFFTFNMSYGFTLNINT